MTGEIYEYMCHQTYNQIIVLISACFLAWQYNLPVTAHNNEEVGYFIQMDAWQALEGDIKCILGDYWVIVDHNLY